MKLFRFGLAAIVLLVLIPESPALSAQESTMTCEGTWHLWFSPGVSTTSQKSTFTTNGETGTLDCVGKFKGYNVTGPGTFSQDGVYEGLCGRGTASSIISYTLPTTVGPLEGVHETTMTIVPGIGLKFSDDFVGPHPFEYRPTAGNCVTDPVTEIDVAGQGVLKS